MTAKCAKCGAEAEARHKCARRINLTKNSDGCEQITLDVSGGMAVYHLTGYPDGSLEITLGGGMIAAHLEGSAEIQTTPRVTVTHPGRTRVR